jgi:hypothetical protein
LKKKQNVFRRLSLVLALAATASLSALAGSAAAAGPRPVLVGFEDEPSFLWSPNRIQNIGAAGEAGANVIRIIANWATLQPGRSSYRFNELDDAIWQAQQRGMRVLLTVWGTPRWASASHKPSAAPNPTTLGRFCGVLAARYNGSTGRAPVTLFSVWNEPNLAQFLSPQYNKKGRDLAPHLYAGMVRACYGAIKKANPSAIVAAGETSPRGTDHPRKGIQQSHSPGRFAQLVAAEKPRIRFDAWAHHPYGVGFTGSATVPFRWPNVSVVDLPRLEAHLKTWFHKSTVPLWITEFAYQTAPEAPRALTYSQQASYLQTAFTKAVAVPQVQMFIWFVYRDTPRERWQSGLVRSDSTPKPALALWRQAIAPYSVDNPVLRVAPNKAPTVALPLVVLQAHYSASDPPIGMSYRVYDASGKLVVGAQATSRLDLTGTGRFTLAAFTPAPGGRYTVQMTVNDIHGTAVSRTATVVS